MVWAFLLLPLQPCSILNHKHFVGKRQYIQYVKCLQLCTTAKVPQDMMTAKILVLNCSVYCHLSNTSDGNSTLHGINMSQRLQGVDSSLMAIAFSPLRSFIN